MRLVLQRGVSGFRRWSAAAQGEGDSFVALCRMRECGWRRKFGKVYFVIRSVGSNKGVRISFAGYDH
jgi:hypothetical protein